jgi:hypothetical protein
MALATIPNDTIDFSRYAPDRAAHALAPDGELTQIWRVFVGSLSLMGQSIAHAVRILACRAKRGFVKHVLHSLKSAWIIGAAGWGSTAAFLTIYSVAG